MTFGQGPQALAEYLRQNWEPSRTGRPDLPDVLRDSGGNPSTDPADATEKGKVIILADRQDQININHAAFDAIYCYHPEAAPPSFEDVGAREQTVEELVQIDIEATDRNDPQTGERLNARNRMVGVRGATGSGTGSTLNDDGGSNLNSTTGTTLGTTRLTPTPYPGLAGEVRYLLELTRRRLDEWDVARTDAVNVFLGNSNANYSYRTTLEQVGVNTADIGRN